MHTLAVADFEWRSQHYYDPCANYFASDSWVEISSQPSSSSLSSANNDEIVTTGLRVQQQPRTRRRKVARPGAPSNLHNVARTFSAGGVSSQEEYEESESESDRVMTSSGEGPYMAGPAQSNIAQNYTRHESSDDENRTAINYPIHGDGFTPQPNAFTYPPSAGHTRTASQPVPGSYFPAPSSRPSTRRSLPSHRDSTTGHHLPQNILSPSYNAAAQHDEALRASLNTLLSCAAAARNISKPNAKSPGQQQQPSARGNRVDPMSFRLVPESALPQQQTQTTAAIAPATTFHEPTFKPTLRRTSTSTTSTSPPPGLDRISKELHQSKRKSSPSKSRRSSPAKKSRHYSSDPATISPTLLTWVVSAGVMVVLSAISFSAGYSLGREAGRLEAEGFGGGLFDLGVGGDAGCAREVAGRSMGLKRSLAREALQV